MAFKEHNQLFCAKFNAGINVFNTNNKHKQKQEQHIQLPNTNKHFVCIKIYELIFVTITKKQTKQKKKSHKPNSSHDVCKSKHENINEHNQNFISIQL